MPAPLSIDFVASTTDDDTKRMSRLEVSSLVARTQTEPSDDADTPPLAMAADFLSATIGGEDDPLRLMRTLYGAGDAEGARRIGAFVVAASVLPVFDEEKQTEDELEILESWPLDESR